MYDPEDQEESGSFTIIGLVVVHDEADNAAQLTAARLLLRSVFDKDGVEHLQFRAYPRLHEVIVHHVVPSGTNIDTSVLNGSATFFATGESSVHHINRGWRRLLDRGADRVVVVYSFSALTEAELLRVLRSSKLVETASWGFAAGGGERAPWLDEKRPLAEAVAGIALAQRTT